MTPLDCGFECARTPFVVNHFCNLLGVNPEGLNVYDVTILINEDHFGPHEF